MYLKTYIKLCAFGKSRSDVYGHGSELHTHHIIPKHSNGTNDKDNITYLTIREHIIAHFLLWKLHKNPNDLRAMYMLGAKLTSKQRSIIGIFCRDNKIGYHKLTKEERRIYGAIGLETQKASNDENTFYFWSTEEGRRRRASLGGKASSKSPNKKDFSNLYTKDELIKIATKGSNSSGKIPVTNGTITKKFKTIEERDEFLQKNNDWYCGMHWKRKRE